MQIKTINPTKLPQHVTDEQEVSQKVGELRRAIQGIQQAVCALSAMPDFTLPHTADVNKWEEALAEADQRTESATKAIKQDVRLNSIDKASAVADWKSWHRRIAIQVGIITKHLASWPSAQFGWSNVANNIVATREITEIAVSHAQCEVPAEATEHARLISSVATSVEALRTWEQSHDVFRRPLESLLTMDENELAVMWGTGNAVVDHRFDDPRIIANRQLAQQRIL